jgi:hypothetical protein
MINRSKEFSYFMSVSSLEFALGTESGIKIRFLTLNGF